VSDPQDAKPTVTIDGDGKRRGAASTELPRGTSVGRYLVLHRLGQGGMGVVWAAYDPKLDRQVALKMMHEGSEADDVLGRRLEREAQAMARLNHPNVVAVYDTGAWGGRLFIAMELVEGDTLAQWLKASPHGWREIRDAFVAAGRGLAAAHGAGLVHRDFKPSNVLVGKDGRIRVTDFGLARSERQAVPEDEALQSPESPALDPAQALTGLGTVLGTPAYMAPEQREGGIVDARSDQFSFCVALYEALYGVRPQVSDSPLDASAEPPKRKTVPIRSVPRPFAAVEEKEPAPARLNGPRWLERALKRGLKRDPAQRYVSTDAMLDALTVSPRAKLWRLAAVGGAVLAVSASAATFGVRTYRESQRCGREAQDATTEAWSPERKDRIRGAFDATQLRFAADAFDAVARTLDGQAEQWRSASAALCEAERKSLLPDREVTRRRHCLDNRHLELKALADLLSRADAQVVEGAATAVARLPRVEGCAAAEVQAVTPPDSGRSDALRAQLARARVLGDAGKHADAAAEAKGALADARARNEPQIAAEAMLLLADESAEAEGRPVAEDALREALFAAEAARHDELAAELRTRLVLEGFRATRKDAEQEQIEHEARAALDRVGDPPQLLAHYFMRVAGVRNVGNKLDEAVDYNRRALELYVKQLGPDHPDVGAAELALGQVLINVGKYDEALVHLRRDEQIVRAWSGEKHPGYAVPVRDIGLAFAWSGHVKEAAEQFQRAVDILEAAYGPDHPSIWQDLCNLAEAQQELGEFPQARANYERALVLFKKVRKEDDMAMAEPLSGLGRAYAAEGDWEMAIDAFERALVLREQFPGERGNLAETQLGLANALWESKRDRPRAVTLAQSAQKLYAQGGDGDKPRREKVEAWLTAHPPR
jgi:tetratricopeptide (TPR) repeat protein